MNNAGRELLACMPPTRAAAMMTASGRSASKNRRTPQLVRQVQLLVRAKEQVRVALSLQRPHERRAHQPAVARNIDRRSFVELHDATRDGCTP